ncbi:MAG: hypothetical protein A2629_03010 [Candidatus Levybacteria bacterium RIFCSPHIGHO2_01_FULL_41_15]|nr:MAG: hypothetical protein A2629_03010 [Candidatus Levybacteria bacterium RIFCSPHIGHO2_01_FULL_41_15]
MPILYALINDRWNGLLLPDHIPVLVDGLNPRPFHNLLNLPAGLWSVAFLTPLDIVRNSFRNYINLYLQSQIALK